MKYQTTTVTRRTKPTVLIAEDDEAMGRIVSIALKAAGFRTLCVDDGVDAINAIINKKPDMIVLDLILPRLHGTTVCSMVRKSDGVRHTPILVMSGCDSVKSKLCTYDVGADDYVTKPFNVSELIARIEALWHRSRTRNFPTPFLSPEWN
jgi:DNA-binding response OmpR family regulator